MTADTILLFAIAGLVCSTGFLILIVIAAMRFRRRRVLTCLTDLPAITILKPVCGLEPGLEQNLASFFEQDYPDYEIVFGARSSEDPAVAVVRELQGRYPNIRSSVEFSGPPDRPNAKICSLLKMYAAAAHDFIVMSDSDVCVGRDYLRHVVSPLLDQRVGLVTCAYRGVPGEGIWSRLDALGMSVEMTSGVLVADLLEGMKFALGPSMATRRDVLQAIGGVEALADYYADDFVLGNEVHQSGRRVVLSHYVVEQRSGHTFQSCMRHQVRWMRSTRFSRPVGHLGTALTFAMPFGVLGLIAGVASGQVALGLSLFAWAVLNRIINSVVAGWVVRDPIALRDAWLYPVRDFMGFCFWCASYLGRDIVWRHGERYRFQQGGKMLRIVK
jgi:ceramide glucosyltransferase